MNLVHRPVVRHVGAAHRRLGGRRGAGLALRGQAATPGDG
jgi:hypothetical protein